MRGVRGVGRIVELCEKTLRLSDLPKGRNPKEIHLYDVLIEKNEYGIKYSIPLAHMFVVEGMEKVRDIIEKNRKRNLAKHKKLSNNTIIKIDNCSPLEILKLQKHLPQIAEQE